MINEPSVFEPLKFYCSKCNREWVYFQGGGGKTAILFFFHSVHRGVGSGTTHKSISVPRRANALLKVNGYTSREATPAFSFLPPFSMVVNS